MLKLAVCDDDQNDRIKISQLLSEWSEHIKKNGVEVTIDVYDNGDALLDGGVHEIVLLDVLMPLLNGIETARELRKKDETVSIIYLTSSPEYAIDSYSVQAVNYLLKPVNRASLFTTLDKCVSIIDKRNTDCMLICADNTLCKVNLHNIEYIEAANHAVLFHLHTGIILKTTSRLADYEKRLLALPNFIKPHRSYIVNLDYVVKLTPSEIISCCHNSLPISRALYTEIKKRYINYLCPLQGAEML
jgi:DNA-binding LytR/AlgR family response regulator